MGKDRAMTLSKWFCRLFAVVVLLSGHASAEDAYQGKVLFMRHALAPGFGDPDDFKIGDCSTQRNLNDEGRAQAREIGYRLRAMGYQFDQVLSSQWCRCVETAALLGMGEVREFAGLNSFFQQHADRDRTLALLRQELAQLGDKRTLMVTHQVVIRAITGRSVSSGGMVWFDPKTGDVSLVD